MMVCHNCTEKNRQMAPRSMLLSGVGSALSLLSFFAIATVLLIAFVPIFVPLVQDTGSIKNSPFSLGESLNSSLVNRFNQRREEHLLSRTITIRKPIRDVFDVVMTPHLWTVCYPETLAVGGIAVKRPVKIGDLVWEKFLYNGMFFSMFRYDFEIVNAPFEAKFHGIQVMSNAIAERLLGDSIRTLGGTFHYQFREIDHGTTEFKRDLYFYSTKDATWFDRLVYRTFLSWILAGQEKGASLFVQCVKTLIESDNYSRELFA